MGSGCMVNGCGASVLLLRVSPPSSSEVDTEGDDISLYTVYERVVGSESNIGPRTKDRQGRLGWG